MRTDGSQLPQLDKYCAKSSTVETDSLQIQCCYPNAHDSVTTKYPPCEPAHTRPIGGYYYYYYYYYCDDDGYYYYDYDHYYYYYYYYCDHYHLLLLLRQLIPPIPTTTAIAKTNTYCYYYYYDYCDNAYHH